MKSVAIKEAKKLEVIETNEPKIDGKNVIVDVKKAGICGSDIHNWDTGQPVGLVMGHEYCGVVTDPGDRDDLKVGDRVTGLPISPCGKCEACQTGNHQYCLDTWTYATGLALTNPGAYAPKMALRSDLVIKVPDNVTDDEAAMVEPTAVGLHAIHLANIKVGDKVLVVGGGIIGLVSAMFAKMEGASYVALTETNPARGEKALKLGVVDEWFDARKEDTIPTLHQVTNGGFDIVIECSGSAAAVTSAFMASKSGGTVVLVGVATNAIAIPTVIAVLHELTVKGAIAYTIEEFKTCLDLLENKKIDVLKFVDDIVSLDEVQASFERLTSGLDPAVKILIDPNK